VFVSYSDDTPDHAERVLELAQWLRTQGIDAHIDQFEESPEQGWPRWIYTQMRESEYVLVVCTPGYLERCEGEVPRGGRAGRAVKFESHLSLQEIHDAEGRNRKFIPLVFNDDDIGECVPMPLRSATHYRLPDQREDLYRRLSDQPKIRRAPLGALRTYDTMEAVDLATASQSIEQLVVNEHPPKRRKRAWSSPQLQRLLTVGAFGLAFLATALFINSALTTGGEIGGGATCRIELTDPNGNAINSDYITLELPAGQEIEFKIENGNTLRFKCPALAVQARVRVDTYAQAERSGDVPMTAASDPSPEAPGQRMLESTFMIQPEPGMQTVRLGVAPDELAEPIPAPKPDSIDTSTTTPGPDLGLGSVEPEQPYVEPEPEPEPGKKRTPAKPETTVELKVAPTNKKLESDLKAKLPGLAACVPNAPQPAVQITAMVQQDAANTIVNVMIDDANLRKQDPAAADCAQREINSWARGETKYNPDGEASTVTLKFGPG
jgi:hypothetical protein